MLGSHVSIVAVILNFLLINTNTISLQFLQDDSLILSDMVLRLYRSRSDVVVKRYNHKGFTHSLRHTIKKSRAHRGWLHGHRLVMLDIATPKPLAYIEQIKEKLIWKCKKGHVWETSGEVIRKGSWCPECKNAEKLLKYIREKGYTDAWLVY